MRANFSYNSPENPASSRALHKLKATKLIPNSSIGQNPMARPVISFNHQPVKPTRENISYSPAAVQPRMERHNSSSSRYWSPSNGGEVTFGANRLNKSITLDRLEFTNSPQVQIKPLSLNTVPPQSIVENNKIRSSSATHNSDHEQSRARALEIKLGEYSLQALQLNMQLSEKSRLIAHYEGELVHFRAQQEQIEKRIAIIVENQHSKDCRVRQLEHRNYELADRVKQLELGSLAKEEEGAVRLNQLTQELIAKNQQVEELTYQYQQLQEHASRYQQQWQAEKTNIERNLQQFKMTNGELENRVLSQQAQIYRLREELRYRDIEARACISKLDDSAKEIDRLGSSILALENELKCCLRELQITKQSERGCRDKNSEFSQQLERVMGDFRAAKSVGQQQIEFLSDQIQRISADNQALLEQIELTKKLTLVRQNLFERKVIYDLKQRNDKLWEKLIQRQEQDKGAQSVHPSQCGRCKELQHQIRQLNSEPTAPQVEFYVKKCRSLEKIVQQHLQINKKLKESLQHSSRGSSDNTVPISKYNFVAESLESCRKTNEALVKSIDRIKAQYQNRAKQQQQNMSNQRQQQNQQVKRLSKANIALSLQVNRLSEQESKWHSLYQELRLKSNSVSPITLLKTAEQEDSQQPRKSYSTSRANMMQLKLKLSFLGSQVEKIRSLTGQIRTQFPRKELINYTEQLITQAASIIQDCVVLADRESNSG